MIFCFAKLSFDEARMGDTKNAQTIFGDLLESVHLEDCEDGRIRSR
jgi:hypothetical protein